MGSLIVRRTSWALSAFLACTFETPPAFAQRSLDPAPARSTLPELSLPAKSPGSLDTSEFSPEGVSVVAARKRGVIPKHSTRGPKTVSAPTLSPLATARSRVSGEIDARAAPLPHTAALDEEGPANGLSLDDAINCVIARNVELRAFSREIPQAEADLLTAGLRSNPLLFADTQFIPYGANNAQRRPLGPTQYDVAVILPLDVSRKRKARVRVASAARSVVQAQYQDAVRRQIANVGHAFVDLQIAYQAKASVSLAREKHERLLRLHENPRSRSEDNSARLETFSAKLQAAIDDVDDALADSRESLGLLLDVPPEDSEQLAPRGRIRVAFPEVPPLEELIRIAIRFRPDLNAARLGIQRADAEIGLAKSNRVDDLILFLDPLSYQDNRPYRLPSGRSWDIGVTVPLPVLNRNQGNIAKARVNADQARLEYAALERRVVSEARLAVRELKSAGAALDKLDQIVRPQAIEEFHKAEADFLKDKMSYDEYFSKLEEEQDSAKSHREALIRYRRAMLDLNAAAGVRLLP